MRKYWRSNMDIDSSKNQTSTKTNGESTQFVGHIRAVQKSEFTKRRAGNKTLGSKTEHRPHEDSTWTRELTETIKNVSRECLDRLTRLENENRELRKRYQNLEAQITPLVKSLNALERVQYLTSVPPNGKTVAYESNQGRQKFEGQLKQLVNVLVRTNLAQNDIREDCWYLKHRVSSLEKANSRLCTLVRQKYPEYLKSCQDLSGTVMEPEPFIDQGLVSSPISVSGKQLGRFKPPQGTGPCLSDGCSPILPKFTLPTCMGSTPILQGVNSASLSSADWMVQNNMLFATEHGSFHHVSDKRPENDVYSSLPSLTRQEQLKVNQFNELQFSSPSVGPLRRLEHVCPTQYEPSRCESPVFDGVLLRALSAPLIAPVDQVYQYLTLTDYNAIRALPFTWWENRICYEHGRLACQDQPQHNYEPLPGFNRNPPPYITDLPEHLSPTLLLPRSWLHWPMLPDASFRRQPAATRSHIVLGARSLPLFHGTVDQMQTKSSKSVEQEPPLSPVDASCSSPSSGSPRQTAHRNCPHIPQLNPIQEVDSNMQSFYDLRTSTAADMVSSERGSKSANEIMRQSANQDDKNSTTNGEPTALVKMQKLLCKDQKLRYLHHARSRQTTMFREGRYNHLSSRCFDLETVLHQQNMFHKCRDAQRNLRYDVYSDTELLTGRFTITSTDDSAADSAEDDGQTSRESLGCGKNDNSSSSFATATSKPMPEAPSRAYPGTVPAAKRVSNPVCCGSQLHKAAGRNNAVNTQATASEDSRTCSRSDSAVRNLNEENNPISPISVEGNISPAKEEIENKLEASGKSGSEKTQKTRSNVPPPVVIHRRRFVGTDKKENAAKVTSDSHSQNVRSNQESPGCGKCTKEDRAYSPQQFVSKIVCETAPTAPRALNSKSTPTMRLASNSELPAPIPSLNRSSPLASDGVTTFATYGISSSTSEIVGRDAPNEIADASVRKQQYLSVSSAITSRRRFISDHSSSSSGDRKVPPTARKNRREVTNEGSLEGSEQSSHISKLRDKKRDHTCRTNTYSSPTGSVRIDNTEKSSRHISSRESLGCLEGKSTSELSTACSTSSPRPYDSACGTLTPGSSPLGSATVKRPLRQSCLPSSSKSSPNSPDYGVTYRRHKTILRPHLTRAQQPSSSQIPRMEFKQYVDPKTCVKWSTGQPPAYLSPVAYEAPVRLEPGNLCCSDFHSNDDIQSPIIPPPIPPRTSSRTYSCQSKTVMMQPSLIPSHQLPCYETRPPKVTCFHVDKPQEMNYVGHSDGFSVKSPLRVHNCLRDLPGGYQRAQSKSRNEPKNLQNSNAAPKVSRTMTYATHLHRPNEAQNSYVLASSDQRGYYFDPRRMMPPNTSTKSYEDESDLLPPRDLYASNRNDSTVVLSNATKVAASNNSVCTPDFIQTREFGPDGGGCTGASELRTRFVNLPAQCKSSGGSDHNSPSSGTLRPHTNRGLSNWSTPPERANPRIKMRAQNFYFSPQTCTREQAI